LLSGCKKPQAKTEEENTPPRTIIEGGGPAVGNVLPAVGRKITDNDLRNFYFYYNEMCMNGSPPSKLEDMMDFQRQARPQMLAPFREGDIIVFWKANTNRFGGNPGSTILAYEKNVPEKGGPVLMMNGTIVDFMSAADFKDAPKAGKP
jgi:hypothetical protein